MVSGRGDRIIERNSIDTKFKEKLTEQIGSFRFPAFLL